jgi:hypothetical protein
MEKCMEKLRGVLIEFNAKDTPEGRAWGVVKVVSEINPADGSQTSEVQMMAQGLTPLPQAANTNKAKNDS